MEPTSNAWQHTGLNQEVRILVLENLLQVHRSPTCNGVPTRFAAPRAGCARNVCWLKLPLTRASEPPAKVGDGVPQSTSPLINFRSNIPLSTCLQGRPPT